MNLRIYIFFSYFILLQSLPAQVTDPKTGNHEVYYQETLDDPYLPNQYQNKKLTPPYNFRHSGLRNNGGTVVITSQVNVNKDGMNILGDAANEPSIAINTFDRNHIVIGWRQFDNVSSNFRQAGLAYSFDAGKTWTFPGVLEPQVFRSDPVLDSDSDGRFYYNSLTNEFRCKVFRSDNDGINWNQGVHIGGGDKQWMTIDKFSSSGRGNIYSSWTPSYTTCAPGFFTRSSTNAESFEACTTLPGGPMFGTMAVDKNGVLYVSGRSQSGNFVVVVKSLNAGIPSSIIEWESPVPVDLDGHIALGSSVNPQGLLGQVNIGIDRSGGKEQGNVYLLASVQRNDDPSDVMFVKSTDRGNSWSNPLKINDDDSKLNHQWFGTMSVAPNGRIDVVWLDTRDAQSGKDNSALYYSWSTNGGETWSKNEKLSGTFDSHVGYPNQMKMGDYFDMKSDNTGAHLAWAATFNGEQDVYYSYIIPDVSVSTKNVLQYIDHSIFPVPSSGRVVIETQGEKLFADIYSMTGQKIKSVVLDENINEIDISSFVTGLYFIKLTDHHGKSTISKIIKE
ncbi:MAG: T9SS type A sorting domain-containing protein [Deltaproteobacteria bacterium]